MRIHPLGRKLIHAEGQTDMTKLTVAFRKFTNATKTRLFFLFSRYEELIYTGE